uniref:Solute carrier family 2 member 2 n=1 Tax=Astyanax mexicanus TaxID=7994 RepID=A0A8B9HRB7_ASTMX
VCVSVLQQLTGTLALAVFAAALGSLQYGYNLGVINAPQEVIQGHYARSLGLYSELESDEEFNITTAEPSSDFAHPSLTMYWSLSVAMFPVGGIISSFLVGFVADIRGRIKGMLVLNILAVVASLLMGLAKMGSPHIMVIAGRAIMGFYCGLSSGLVPMYIGEIAPLKYRGALGTLHQLAIVTGILISQVLGLDFLLGNNDMWHLLLGLSGSIAVLQSVLLPLCPESPRYLYIRLGKKEEACKSMISCLSLNPTQCVVLSAVHSDKLKHYNHLPYASFNSLSSRFSAIFYYSTSIFHNAGVAQPVYATIGVGVVNTIFTLVSVVLVDRAGRRTLMLAGLAGMCLCAVGMTVGLIHLSTYPWMSYLSMSAIFLFVCFFEIGPGPIPWFIVAELFSQGPRPAAIALAGFCNWTSNFIIGISFPYIEKYCGQYVFIIFVVLLFLFTLFTALRVPETKGKTFEEISALFQRKRAPQPIVEAELEQLKGATEA